MVGCQPAASDVMARSVRAGAVQPEAAPPLPTLSDATAGGVEEDSLTLQVRVCVRACVCVCYGHWSLCACVKEHKENIAQRQCARVCVLARAHA